MRTNMNNHLDNHTEDDEKEEEKTSENKNLKPGFLNSLKRRIQHRFSGVHSKVKSRLQKSSSLNERPTDALSPLPSNDVNEDISSNVEPSSSLNNTAEPESSELRTQSLSGHLLQLSKYGWYWGPITREEAEEKLANQPEGSFLVRDSSNDHFLLSVSFRCSGRTFHSRIFHSAGKFSFYPTAESDGFNSIPELVEYSISSSQSTVFCYSRPRSPGHPSFPVRLTKPVSRITHVRSLQYLCRFVIRQYTRVDQIKDLPLPSRICGYIEEGQF